MTQPLIFNANLGKWGRISTEYYLAARYCYFADLLRPAYFSAYHSIECMAKGFLEFKDPKIDGESYGHNWSKIFKGLMKHYPKAKYISIPDYMIKEISYLSILQLISPAHLQWLENIIDDKEKITPGVFSRDNLYKQNFINYFRGK
jgi:hypothetical protein